MSTENQTGDPGDFAQYKQLVEQYLQTNPQTQCACPRCGYCPHCGRGGYYPYPYYPQPYYPYWGPTWIYTGGTVTCSQTAGSIK